MKHSFQVFCMLGFLLIVIVGKNCRLMSMPSIDIDEDASDIITAEPASPQNQLMDSPQNPILNSSNQGNLALSDNEGPSTIDQSEEKIGTHGNWVKKKDFLMRSFDTQKEIEALASTIQGYRSTYQQKFNAINAELDSFYKQLGLEQGKIAELFVQLEEYLKEKKQRRIARFKQELTELREQQMAIEQLEESLKTNKEELAQLQADMKSIEDLDKSISTRMQRSDEQITTAQKEAARTSEIIQSMWDMLDDKKAKAAYFEIKDGILHRLQTIDTYLQQELLNDVDKVGASIQAQIKKARESVKNLEEKGFLIRDRNKRLDDMNAKKAKEAADSLIQQEQVRKRAKIETDRGFFSKLYESIVNFIVKIYRMVTGIFGTSEPALKVKVGVRTPAEQQVAGQHPLLPSPQEKPVVTAPANPEQQVPKASALPVFNVGSAQNQQPSPLGLINGLPTGSSSPQ